MTLRSRSRLIALVSSLVFLVLLGLFLLAYKGKVQTQRDLDVTESLSVATTQLRTALFGHLLHPQPEPRDQVDAQFKVLRDLLDTAAPAIDASIRDDEQTRYAWEGARRLVAEGQALVAELGDARTDPLLTERDSRTKDLILADSHDLILFVSQIRHRAGERFLRASSLENLTLVALLTGLAGLGLGLFLAVERVILAPVQQLHMAAVRVAAGELSLRLKSPRRDELGDLAGAFDRMLDQLQETMVLRARLEVEVAERAQVERALRESDERLQLAMEVSRSFAFEWEPVSDQVRRSASSGAILGVTGAAVECDTGQGYFQRVAEQDRERFVATVQALRPGNDRYRIEYRLTRGDGVTLVLEETARAFFDAAGRLQWLVGATTDITERRHAEAEARLAQVRFQCLVEANIVGIVVADAAGDILEANDFYLDLVGHTRAELAARSVSWLDLTPPEWRWADDKALAELRRRGVCAPYEKEYLRADGARPAVMIVDALLPDGHILGLILDITERRRAEAEVQRLNADLELRVQQRTAQLQSANRELESFAYAVSHDLRAPLRALSGFSQALVEDYAPRLDGQALVFLDQIQSASHRMGELIDGILTLSRSTRGQLRREPVDLGALARRLLIMERAAEPGRQVTWEVAAGLDVCGDPAMLEVVMVNLIENAWKFTAKTPAANIRVHAQERAGVRWFSVADNGAGFDMAYAQRLFQPFQRLHRQDEFPGIGIGLATVQRIINRHGGTIEAEGIPGVGATFRFTLPATSGRPESV